MCFQTYRFCIIQKQDYKMALRKYRKALRYLDVCWEKEEIDEGESLLGILYLMINYVWDQLCSEIIVFSNDFCCAEKSALLRKTKSIILTNSSVSFPVNYNFIKQSGFVC